MEITCTTLCERGHRMVKHIRLEGLERSGDVQHNYACFLFPRSVVQMMPNETVQSRAFCF